MNIDHHDILDTANYTMSRLLNSLRAYARTSQHVTNNSVWSELPLSRRASVLVLLFESENGLSVLLTQRAHNMRSYSGHVAFPGGKADFDTESALQVARRESWEEVGLVSIDPTDSQQRVIGDLTINTHTSDEVDTHDCLTPPLNKNLAVEIEPLCELPSYLSYNLLAVKPCVAYGRVVELNKLSEPGNFEEYKYHDSPNSLKSAPSVLDTLHPWVEDHAEVYEYFEAPFDRFTKKGDGWYRLQKWNWGGIHWPQLHFNVLRKTHKTIGERGWYDVWGLTARILVDAATIATGKPPEVDCMKVVGDEDLIRGLAENGRMPEQRVHGETITDFVSILGKDSPLIAARNGIIKGTTAAAAA